MAFGDLLPARGIGGQRSPDDLGEVGPGRVQIEIEVQPGRLAFDRALLDDQKHGSLGHGIAFGNVEFGDRAANRGFHDAFHLHRVQDDQLLSRQHVIPDDRRDGDHRRLHGGSHGHETLRIIVTHRLCTLLLPDSSAFPEYRERVCRVDPGTGQGDLRLCAGRTGKFALPEKRREVIVNVARVHCPGRHLGVVHHVHQDGQVRVDPGNGEFRQRPPRPADRVRNAGSPL